jgi:uncharacterized protein YdhG (YjbR/CyaY superfamily)
MISNATDIDAYLSALPEETRVTLEAVRQAIRSVAADAVESISYGVPTYKYRGRPLIYFGAAKNHCAVYGIDTQTFADDLAAYDTSKGTVRFPPGEPLPADLLEKLVRTRIAAIDAAARKRRPSRES